MAEVADHHDSIANGNADHRHKTDQRAQGQAATTEPDARYAADQCEQEAEHDQQHQPPRPKLGVEQHDDSGQRDNPHQHHLPS